MNIEKHLPWLSALLPLVSVQAETPPNVVIIYIDDMGIGDIGCYGGKFVATEYCSINIILLLRLVRRPVAG